MDYLSSSVPDTLSEGLSVFFFETDKNGVITQGQKSLSSALGFSPEILPKNLIELTGEPMAAAIVQAYDGVAVKAREFEFYAADGSVRYFLATLYPVKDEEDRVCAVRGIVSDLETEKDLAYALESSEERFSLVFEQCTDPMIIASLNADILSVNPPLEHLAGVEPGDFVDAGGSWENVVPEEDLHRLLATFELCASTGTKQQLECRLGHGEDVEWFELSINTLHDERDRPKGFICIACDISRRKAVERELIEEAGQIEAHQALALNLIAKVKRLLADLSNLPRETAPFVQGVCRILTEMYPGCLITVNLSNDSGNGPLGGRETIADFIDTEMQRDLIRNKAPLYCNDLDTMAPYQDDMMVSEMGMRSFLGAPLQDSSGNVWGTLALLSRNDGVFKLEDIEIITIAGVLVAGRLRSREQEADKQELESHLRQSQKMEAVGKMAGGIAHDFNNILSGILGFSSYLVSRSDPESPIYRDLLMIQKSAERATDLTRQLLAFARKRHFEKKPLSVNKVIGETIGILSHSISKRITIEQDLQVDLPAVMGDESQLNQVFMNLCINAGDAIGADFGTITISTTERSLSVREEQLLGHPEPPPEGYVVITVKDSGCGMSPDVVEHLFEPFFTTKDEDGTGLGLSIVYGIITNHKGEILVDSEPGQGTTFSLFLPGCNVEIPSEESEQADLRGTETILVVDDELIIRRMAVETLTSYGYTVFAAAEGQEALAHVESKGDAIDLVLMDMVMPKMDGAQLFQELEKHISARRLVIMSGYTSEDRFRDFMHSARPDFIEKPFKSDELAAKVREVLDRIAHIG